MTSPRLTPFLLPVLLLPLLGACADLVEEDYRLGHPVAVEDHTLVAVFDRPRFGQDLSSFDQDRLRRLAEESLRRGSGAATVSSGDASFAQTLAARLQRLGVAAKADSAKGGSDEATIAIPVWTARLPECGRFERGMNPDYDNTPNSNWGCSVNRNIAAMVQNPADLVRSREASGRDGNRSADVLDKYGHGAATGSTPEVITAGSASTVGH